MIRWAGTRLPVDWAMWWTFCNVKNNISTNAQTPWFTVSSNKYKQEHHPCANAPTRVSFGRWRVSISFGILPREKRGVTNFALSMASMIITNVSALNYYYMLTKKQINTHKSNTQALKNTQKHRHRHRHRHRHKHRHTNTQTHKHTNTQTHKHTNTQT